MKSVNSTILVLFFISVSSLISGQKVNYIKVPDLENILKASENKLFVVNFWATWCPPCVSELPNFEKVAKEYSTEEVRFIMVSLDFPGQIEKQLVPFLKKNSISLDVFVMTDVDYDSWIDKVDKSWEGNIPATLFFNNTKKKRYFHVGEVDETGLRKIINSNLN